MLQTQSPIPMTKLDRKWKLLLWISGTNDDWLKSLHHVIWRERGPLRNNTWRPKRPRSVRCTNGELLLYFLSHHPERWDQMVFNLHQVTLWVIHLFIKANPYKKSQYSQKLPKQCTLRLTVIDETDPEEKISYRRYFAGLFLLGIRESQEHVVRSSNQLWEVGVQRFP